MTKDEAVARIEGVLKAAGIKVDLWICECDLEVEFPDGAKGVFYDTCVSIVCDGLPNKRG